MENREEGLAKVEIVFQKQEVAVSYGGFAGCISQATLYFSIESKAAKAIALYDMIGRLLQRVSSDGSIDATSIPNGFYILQATVNEIVYTKRVVARH